MPAGFYPFWFWNDRLTENEIRWQIREMADKGIRGFFIHSRQGLDQPYLSEAFFRMVDAAVDEAERQEMLVHLYDEYPYPSGAAGGLVTLGEPRFHATRLVHQTLDVEGGVIRLELPAGKTLCCRAFPVFDGEPDWTANVDLLDAVGPHYTVDAYLEGGLTSYNRKRYWANTPVPTLEIALPMGTWRVCASSQVTVKTHKYFGSFADVMNPEAVRRFIEVTHERYFARYGDRFGDSILSIFVDETCPAWSPLVPPRFREVYGYDLIEFLPALADPDHPDHLRVAFDLRRLELEMFEESFDKPIAAWCREHGLAYSGEKPPARLSQLRHMDIPGGDSGHTKVGAEMDLTRRYLRQNMRAMASAAHFYGRAGALCECYHSLGWSGTIQDAKLMADGLLLMGVPWLVPHAFFYSTHALTKHDAPPTFFFQQPYWPLFGRLSERVDVIGRAFEGTRMDAAVFVVDPTLGSLTSKPGKEPDPVHAMLLDNHLDYLVVDTDILEAATVAEGRVTARDVTADVVLVPFMDMMEEPLRAWLERFEVEGGKVVRCPNPLDREAVERELLGAVSPSLSVRADGGEVADVQVVRRVGDERTLWLLVNVGGETWDAELDAGRPLREVPLDPNLPPSLECRQGRYTRRIAPFEGLLLEAAEAHAETRAPAVVPVAVEAKAGPRARDRNLLRLYEWGLSIVDERGASGESALVPAIPLANQLEKSGLPFTPDVRVSTAEQAVFSMPTLQARYGAVLQCRFEGEVELVMEPGSIVGDWSVRINDGEFLTAESFGETTAHVRGSLGADVTAMLRPGENRIVVDVATDRPDGGLLNALYLAGDFGVTLDPPTLTDPVAQGGFERYLENRLPHYAGVVDYTTEFALDALPEGDPVVVEFLYPAPFHEATEVSLNGGPFRPLVWTPRRLAVPREEVKVGPNTLVTRVYTTLIRSFEGQWFDPDRHAHRDASDVDPA